MQRNCVGLRKERAQREEKKGTDCIARLPTFALPYPPSVIKSFFVYLHRTIAISLLLLLFYARQFSYLQDKEQRKEKKIREVMAKKVSYGNDM